MVSGGLHHPALSTGLAQRWHDAQGRALQGRWVLPVSHCLAAGGRAGKSQDAQPPAGLTSTLTLPMHGQGRHQGACMQAWLD